MDVGQKIQIGIGITTVFAIILGPIIALWLQRISERRREAGNRKVYVFRTLMASRATRLSQNHIEALNAIEVEFGGSKENEKRVIEAWKLYLDHLATKVDQSWTARGDDIFTDLLYEMARCLNYSFDKVWIKRNIYYPKGHGEIEEDQYIIRKALVKLLTGQNALKMDVESFPLDEDFAEKQKKLTEASIEILEGRKSVPVKIVDDLKQKK